MAGMVLPIIAEADYRAFRKILRQYLPPRYDAWESESARHLRDLLAKRVVAVTQTVTAEGFAEWLRSRRVPADMSRLMAYAWEMSEQA